MEKNKDNTQYVTFHMKPPKFMIGDIVDSHGFTCVVNAVYPWNKDYSYRLNILQGESLGKICQEDVKGIPLTQAILEKNGWKIGQQHSKDSYDDVNWNEYVNPSMTFVQLRHYSEYDTFAPFCCNNELSQKDVLYVHQLQHLLFGLGINTDMEV